MSLNKCHHSTIARLSLTYIEIDISTASALTTHPFNTKNNFIIMVFHTEFRLYKCPFLFDGSQMFARRSNIKCLQTTWKTAKLASQWTMKTNDLIFSNIKNFHFKWTRWTAQLTRATVRFFFCPIHLRKYEIEISEQIKKTYRNCSLVDQDCFLS